MREQLNNNYNTIIKIIFYKLSTRIAKMYKKTTKKDINN